MITLRKTPLLALALLLCLAPAAFGAEAALSKTTLFVDAPWVKENASKLIFVDARASSLYAKGHIPGAVNAEWTYFANVKGQPGNPGWGEIFPQDTLAKKIGALGINGKQPIVVYGDCGGWGQEGWAAWVFWLIAHIYFLIGFRNRLMVLIDWATAYWSEQRYARIIANNEPRASRAPAPAAHAAAVPSGQPPTEPPRH